MDNRWAYLFELFFTKTLYPFRKKNAKHTDHTFSVDALQNISLHFHKHRNQFQHPRYVCLL